MSEAAVAAGLSRLLSDERLTRRAVSGDERAFAAIFRRYHQSLYRFCLTIVGNPEDAQDALQNTMVKVLHALPGEEREIELRPWLYRIAHNESIDLLRGRRETRELDVEQVAPAHGLAEDAATRERLRRLIADLRELPERQREVLVMRELAGLDFEEIGTALSTSEAVARQTLYEARQSLRQMEKGREMSCETVMKALSDGDGRITRRRDVRAHLRSCAGCRGFRDEIESRQRDLAALSPLPAIAAVGMLQGLIGGSQAATGGGLAAMLGGGAAQGIGASAAAKGAATVAVAAAIGVTAADRTGVIHLGLPDKKEATEAAPERHSLDGGKGPAGSHRGGGAGGNGRSAREGGRSKALGKMKGSGKGAEAGRGAGRDAGRGDVASDGRHGVEALPGAPGNPPVQPGGAAPGQETASSNHPSLPELPPPANGGGDRPTAVPGPPGSSPPAPSPGQPPAETPAAGSPSPGSESPSQEGPPSQGGGAPSQDGGAPSQGGGSPQGNGPPPQAGGPPPEAGGPPSAPPGNPGKPAGPPGGKGGGKDR